MSMTVDYIMLENASINSFINLNCILQLLLLAVENIIMSTVVFQLNKTLTLHELQYFYVA